MRITNVRTVVVKGNFDWPLVRVDTDEGVYGLGEVRDHIPGGPNSRTAQTDPRRMVAELKPLVIGQDPTDVLALFRKIRSYGGPGRYGGAVSGIEIALWDILGKVLGVPVYKLLGGMAQSRARIYCDCHAGKPITQAPDDYVLDNVHYTPEAYASNARAQKEKGFTLLKFDLYPEVASLVPGGMRGDYITAKGLEYITSIVQAIVDSVGPDTEVAFDCAGFMRLPVAESLRLARALDSFQLRFLEDLVPTSNIEGWLEVTRSISTPTLTGEDLYTAEAFKPLIEKGAIKIAGPDLLTVGGIGEARRVAELCELYGREVFLHFAGSPIGMMASVHVTLAMPNIKAIEFHSVSLPWWEQMVKGQDLPLIKDGFILPPTGPGLGITLNEAVVWEHAASKEEAEGFFA